MQVGRSLTFVVTLGQCLTDAGKTNIPLYGGFFHLDSKMLTNISADRTTSHSEHARLRL